MRNRRVWLSCAARRQLLLYVSSFSNVGTVPRARNGQIGWRERGVSTAFYLDRGPIDTETMKDRPAPGSNATGTPFTMSGFTNADPM